VDLEDGGDMFLRSMWLFLNYTVITEKAILFLTRLLFGLFGDTTQHSP
jgi:hypothetical protein